MNRTIYRIAILLLLIFCLRVYGGEYSFDFLELGIGTRAKALGGSFASVADDGSSLFWNPAGTSRVLSTRFYFMHNTNFAGMSNIDYVSFIKPIPAKSFFSVALLRHCVGDIPIFPELEGTAEDRDTIPSLQGNGEPMGYFDETASIYLINLSKHLAFKKINILIGGNFKYFDETIYDYSGTGLGVDAGSIVSSPIKGIPGFFSIGLTLENLTGTEILWNTASKRKDMIPTNYRFGLSYKTTFDRIDSGFLLTYDYRMRYGTSHHTGLEFSYRNNFLVDVGLNKGNFSFGTGLKFWKIGIQYGFIPHTLGSNHSLSMELIL